MKLKRFLIYVLIFMYYILFRIIITLKAAEAGGGFSGDFSKIIPPDDLFIEHLVIYLFLFPISAIVGVFIIGYVLTPLFFIIYRKIIGKKLDYGIQTFKSSYQGVRFKNLIYPVLMAMNFAMMLATNSYLNQLIAYPSEYAYLLYVRVYMPTFTITLIPTLALSFGLFSVVWSFNDVGFVHINSKEVKEKGKKQIIEGKALGSTYETILKGYAGIGALFTYYEFILIIYDELIYIPAMLISNLIIIIPLPIYLTISSLPAILMYDTTKGIRIKMLKKLGRRYDIHDGWEIKLQPV